MDGVLLLLRLPWWIVGAGVDDVARSLFFVSYTSLLYFLSVGVLVLYSFSQ
ncbi:hypothetical protein ECDEC3A_0796 [Escherichia coli DEC3A]|nr:hypothetical protein ECDEC3A_0796 [Escherichia coli DEC3A]